MLNVIALNGRLTADPVLRQTQSGVPVASFTIAVDRPFSNKQTNERETDFFRVTVWRSTAEFVSRYFRKGQLVAVEGRCEIRQYVDNQGVQRTSVEVAASNVHFAEKKSDFAGEAAPRPAQPQAKPLPDQPVSFESGSADDFSEISADDDLPF